MTNLFAKIILVSTTIFASLATQAQPNQQVDKARKELLKAKADSTSDAQKFITQSRKRIEKNQQKIELLKAKNASENQEINAKYQEKMKAIQDQNNELKSRIDGIESVNTGTWATFKRKFKYDMKELVRVIEDND